MTSLLLSICSKSVSPSMLVHIRRLHCPLTMSYNDRSVPRRRSRLLTHCLISSLKIISSTSFSSGVRISTMILCVFPSASVFSFTPTLSSGMAGLVGRGTLGGLRSLNSGRRYTVSSLNLDATYVCNASIVNRNCPRFCVSA